MIGKIENVLGDIIIDEAVIAKIAATVASASYGVVGMAYRSTADAAASLLKGETSSQGREGFNRRGEQASHLSPHRHTVRA